MNTRAPHKTFDLTYTPKYGFSIFYLIFHVGVIIILLVGLILNFRNYDLLFKIISIIFLLAFCINIFSIVELVGRESVGISHDSIIWTQTLYGISKKRVLSGVFANMRNDYYLHDPATHHECKNTPTSLHLVRGTACHLPPAG